MPVKPTSTIPAPRYLYGGPHSPELSKVPSRSGDQFEVPTRPGITNSRPSQLETSSLSEHLLKLRLAKIKESILKQVIDTFESERALNLAEDNSKEIIQTKKA